MPAPVVQRVRRGKGGKPVTLKQRVGTGLASAPRRTVAVDTVEDKTGAIVVIQQDRIADAMGGDVGDHQIQFGGCQLRPQQGELMGGYLGDRSGPGRLRLVLLMLMSWASPGGSVVHVG